MADTRYEELLELYTRKGFYKSLAHMLAKQHLREESAREVLDAQPKTRPSNNN